jgi:hypothetical protein
MSMGNLAPRDEIIDRYELNASIQNGIVQRPNRLDGTLTQVPPERNCNLIGQSLIERAGDAISARCCCCASLSYQA